MKDSFKIIGQLGQIAWTYRRKSRYAELINIDKLNFQQTPVISSKFDS